MGGKQSVQREQKQYRRNQTVRGHGKLIVAAIDLGTTYSGVAYSFKDEFKSDPTDVKTSYWHGGNNLSAKAPTCVLIKPDGKTFHSFGYKAETDYATLADTEEHKNWYYFRHFKRTLFRENGLSGNVMLEDETEKELPAKQIFMLSIRYLKDVLLEMVGKRLTGLITNDDIHWVLTVPAIWSDAAKHFMRVAAEEAGISGDNLTIGLEPECAALFCRHICVEKVAGAAEKSLETFKAGTKYLVLDAGGGTVDIAVHEVNKDGTIKEVQKVSGEAFGGINVNQAFESFLTDLFGEDLFRSFKLEHMDDYIDLCREFEIKKRDIDEKGRHTSIKLSSLVNLFEKENGTKFGEFITNSSFSESVFTKADKLRIKTEFLHSLFRPTISSIIDHVKYLLQQKETRRCSIIMMVGGFSECSLLQTRIKESFSDMKIVIPKDAGLVVLKGAVVYGHNPTAIAERICRFTYGIRTRHTKSSCCEHPDTTTNVIKGITSCTNIFDIHVKAGQCIRFGEEQKEEIYAPLEKNQTMIGFPIYTSDRENPELTTEDGCREIGKVTIPLPDITGGLDRKVGVSMMFGGTEIEVKAVEKSTGKDHYYHVDFLG